MSTAYTIDSIKKLFYGFYMGGVATASEFFGSLSRVGVVFFGIPSTLRFWDIFMFD